MGPSCCAQDDALLRGESSKVKPNKQVHGNVSLTNTACLAAGMGSEARVKVLFSIALAVTNCICIDAATAAFMPWNREHDLSYVQLDFGT